MGILKIEKKSMKALIFVCLLTFALSQKPTCPCETSLNKMESDAKSAWENKDVSQAMALVADVQDVADKCLPHSWEDVDKCPCLKAWKDLALDAQDAVQKMDLGKLMNLVNEYHDAMKACGVNSVQELGNKLMKKDVIRFLRRE